MRTVDEPERGEVGEEWLSLRDPHKGRRAGKRHLARGEQLLRLIRQAQEVQAVGDEPLALADQLRHLRRVAVLVDETAVGAGFLKRAEVGANDVLRYGQRERVAVDLSNLGGHLAELRRACRTVAPLTGDDRVAAVAVARERQWADDPVELHGLDQLGHAVVVEVRTRVRLARPDLCERNHAQRCGHDCVPPSVKSASARSLSAAGSVARSKRAS